MSLPSGYKRLEYIQFSGAQYLPSITIPQDFKIEVTLAAGTTGSYMNIYDHNAAKPMLWVDGNKILEMDTVKSGYTLWTEKVTIVSDSTGDSSVLSVNGTVVQTAAKVKGTSFTVTLFNRAGSQCFVGDLFALKVSSKTETIVDYVPCIDASGNVGVYDLVGKQFYGNAGTGTFTAGPVIIAIAASESEITEIEYIQSSGTQYIDTGYIPNPNTTMEAELLMSGTFKNVENYGGANSIFGVSNGTSQYSMNFGAGANEGNTVYTWLNKSYESGAQIENLVITDTIRTNRNKLAVGKGRISWGTASRSVTAKTTTQTTSLVLFGNKTNGVISAFTSYNMRVFSWQIKENETIVHDFIPAKLISDNAIGLYDKLNGLLYINVGSGAFTAGPEVLKTPPTPTGFAASMLTNTTVKLSWAASDGATGYNLYKNDALLATLTDTSYTDTVKIFNGTVYAVTAYNDYGESAAAELTYCSIPENPILYLVTDRTESDVAYVKLLSGKGLVGMSDVEKAEWLSGLKGSYNALDLNRVESAVDYVARRLQIFGNAVEVYIKKDWATKDVPNVSAMKQYLDDVSALRAVLSVLPTTPEVPPDMDGLTYNEANNIEQILKDIDLLINNMTAAWFYSYDLYAGEV